MNNAFLNHYRGYFAGILRWDDLDKLWKTIRTRPEGWYVYLVNHTVPDSPAPPIDLERFLREMDSLLRKEHEHDYCGIVYADP
jgi:hypothetical protein